MRQALLVVLAAFVAANPGTAADVEAPQFTFLKSEVTGKHVAIQPKEEHHRVYFPLQVEHAAKRTAFARVRCKPDGDDAETVQTVYFKVTAAKELWRVYLRAPRHEDKAATYQAEVGYVDGQRADPDVVCGTCAWRVLREGGQVHFVTEVRRADGAVEPVGLPVLVRVAVLIGGAVEFRTEARYARTPVLTVGLDRGAGGSASVNGSGAVRVRE